MANISCRLFSPTVSPSFTKHAPTIPSVPTVPPVSSGPVSGYSDQDAHEGVDVDNDDGVPLDDQLNRPLWTSRRAAAILYLLRRASLTIIMNVLGSIHETIVTLKSALASCHGLDAISTVACKRTVCKSQVAT